MSIHRKGCHRSSAGVINIGFIANVFTVSDVTNSHEAASSANHSPCICPKQTLIIKNIKLKKETNISYNFILYFKIE